MENPPASGALLLCALAQEELSSWDDNRVQDALGMNDFLEVDPPIAEIQSYSIALPANVDVQEVFEKLRAFSTVEVEITIAPDRADSEDIIALASEREYLSIGISSGLRGDADPIARQIVECCGLEIPFRLVDLSGQLITSGSQIGFLNAMVASTLAFAEELGPTQVAEILGSESASTWLFECDEMSYRRISVSLDQIRDVRTIVNGVRLASIEGLSVRGGTGVS